MDSVYVTNLTEYTDQLIEISKYLQMLFYALVILIVLNVIKGA